MAKKTKPRPMPSPRRSALTQEDIVNSARAEVVRSIFDAIMMNTEHDLEFEGGEELAARTKRVVRKAYLTAECAASAVPELWRAGEP